jgi:hypothetical protein
MQSFRRAIGRGQAVIAFDAVYRCQEFYRKKGTPRRIWAWAVKNQLWDEQMRYCRQVTGPLAWAYIDRCGDDRHIYDN